MNFEIDIAVQHAGTLSPREIQSTLDQALHLALKVEQAVGAVLSVSVVGDAAMHRLNREHLNHDYTTDVISFPLDWSGPGDEPPLTADGRACGAMIEGEIVVNLDYAERVAAEVDWEVLSELTLYTIHGMLHICGYDDLTAPEKDIMRSREAAVLNSLGLQPHYPLDDSPADRLSRSSTSPAAEDPQ